MATIKYDHMAAILGNFLFIHVMNYSDVHSISLGDCRQKVKGSEVTCIVEREVVVRLRQSTTPCLVYISQRAVWMCDSTSFGVDRKLGKVGKFHGLPLNYFFVVITGRLTALQELLARKKSMRKKK